MKTKAYRVALYSLVFCAYFISHPIRATGMPNIVGTIATKPSNGTASRGIGMPNIVGTIDCGDCHTYDQGPANGTEDAAIDSQDYAIGGLMAFINPTVVILITPSDNSNYAAFMYDPSDGYWICVIAVNNSGLNPTQIHAMVETKEFAEKVRDAFETWLKESATSASGGGPSGGYGGPTPGNGSTPFDGVPVYVDWQGGLVKVGPLCDAHGNCTSY